MANLRSDYRFLPCDDDSETPPENDVIYSIGTESSKAQWNHIKDLDAFLRRAYIYYRKYGLMCIFIAVFLQLLLLTFIVGFSSYLVHCIDYSKLGPLIFKNNTHHQVTLDDLQIPLNICVKNLGFFSVFCLSVSFVFLVFLIIHSIRDIWAFKQMKNFYDSALKITSDCLENVTWHEVQCRLREVQRELHMCVHKEDLTELDIYHRILRKENYMVAMVNKNVLPMRYSLGFLGEWVYFPTGLQYNLELLLFSCPLMSPFNSMSQLKESYKKFASRSENANSLKNWLYTLAAVNFLVMPVLFLWHLLYITSTYAGYIRFDPGFLCTRRWSAFAHLSLRHFNELDHELEARLNRAHVPASQYMNSFSSKWLGIAAENGVKFFGFITLALFSLAIFEDSILQVPHMFTLLTVSTLITAVSMKLIPDPTAVFVPELGLKKVIADIHYAPDNWKGNAHAVEVRNQFRQLFQLKVSHLIEEILSPIVTPLLLGFFLPQRTLDIVDFLRNFTVDVVGVGDVCSYALLDVNKHGNHQWLSEGQSQADQYQQAENGKTELSLLHFTMTNPDWVPPPSSSAFLVDLREKIHCDAEQIFNAQTENPLCNSLGVLRSFGSQYDAVADSITASVHQTGSAQSLLSSRPYFSTSQPLKVTGGGVSLSEGPLCHNQIGIFSSLQDENMSNESSMILNTENAVNPAEYRAAGMSLSTLYLHELHDKKMQTLKQQRQTQSFKEITEEGAKNDEYIPLIVIKK